MPPDPKGTDAFLPQQPRDRPDDLIPNEAVEYGSDRGLLQRFWMYQKERFPLFKHGLLIAIFSGAAVGYGARLTDTHPTLSSAFVAFLSTFAFFWQMRVADEFKDLADDAQYRPYRPVPRGLVSLRELALAGFISAAIQASLALWLAPALLGFILCIWAYFGLMCKEFFVRDWLKSCPVAYVLSHMVIVPMIGGYAVAVQTMPRAGMALSWSLLPFLLACFCNGLVIEIGRKTRLPDGEEIGVETYSALWGLAVAVRLWLGAVILTAVFSLGAAWQIQTLAVVVPMLMALLGWVGFKAWPWLGTSSAALADRLSSPAPKAGAAATKPAAHDLLDTPTALWTLGVYLGLGWLPWLLGGG